MNSLHIITYYLIFLNFFFSFLCMRLHCWDTDEALLFFTFYGGVMEVKSTKTERANLEKLMGIQLYLYFFNLNFFE